MKKDYIGGEILALSQTERLELKYYILTQNKFYSELNEEFVTYGIEIESSSKAFSEFNRVEDITLDKEKIKFIAKMLKENIVTPIHLNEVIEDFI